MSDWRERWKSGANRDIRDMPWAKAGLTRDAWHAQRMEDYRKRHVPMSRADWEERQAKAEQRTARMTALDKRMALYTKIEKLERKLAEAYAELKRKGYPEPEKTEQPSEQVIRDTRDKQREEPNQSPSDHGMRCQGCGQPFTSRRNDALYCGTRCRQRAHRNGSR